MEINGVAGDGSEPAVVKRRSRKRHITIFIVVSIVNATLLAVLWFALLTPASNQPGSNSNVASTLGDVTSPLIGKSAPDFTLPALNAGGAKVRLADLKGKAVMLNFWQSSCDPCNQEAPFLQKTWSQVQSKNVVFIGIDVPDTSDAARAFLHKYGITYLNVEDTLNSTTGISYGIGGFPETFFIDSKGVVVAKWMSPLTTQGMQLELAKLNIK